MKSNLTVSIDIDIYREIKQKNLIISKLINEFLKNYLDRQPVENLSKEQAIEIIRSQKIVILNLQEQMRQIHKRGINKPLQIDY